MMQYATDRDQSYTTRTGTDSYYYHNNTIGTYLYDINDNTVLRDKTFDQSTKCKSTIVILLLFLFVSILCSSYYY
jgi:hypothetical protein